MSRYVGAAVVLVVLAAGCASGHESAHKLGPETSAPAAKTLVSVTPKQEAIALGARMLDQTLLPPGANRSSGREPAAFGGLLGIPDIGNVVTAHRVFTVGDTPHATWQWFEAHVPRGFSRNGGSAGTELGAQLFGVDDELSAFPPNVSLATLVIRVTGNISGHTVVRVDAAVGWTAPRPADERVSGRDRVAIVTTIHVYEPGKPIGKRVVATTARLVQPIVDTFNRLAVEPPPGKFGLGGCGFIGNDAVEYRVAFASSPTASPDVVATIPPCGAIGVSVDGHAAPALTSGLTTDVARVITLSARPR
jgi:hypothetical protein